jgi:hypothetical protein
MGPLVTVPEARRLLGEIAKGLSDADIEKEIIEMDRLASLVIEMYRVPKSNEFIDDHHTLGEDRVKRVQ